MGIKRTGGTYYPVETERKGVRMEFNVATQAIATNNILLNQMIEQAVDCELVLPDFCPDLSRVLKCKTTTRITSKAVQSGRLTMEGVVLVNVMYVDAEEGGVRAHEAAMSFTREVDVPGASEECAAMVESRVSYMNCRVLTARKLDLHGAVTLHVRVGQRRPLSILTGAEGCCIKLQKQELPLTTMTDSMEKYIPINEDIELGENDRSVRCILRSEGCVKEAECKPVGGRVVLKGELTVCAVYCTENPRVLGRVEQAIPFSQILDLEGVDEDNVCDAVFEVTSLEMHPRTGLDGECKTISVSAAVLASITVTRDVVVPVITDCYSTKFDMAVERSMVSGQRRADSFHETYRCKKTIELPVEAEQILDCWCECMVDSSRVQDNTLMLDGRIVVCMLATDADGGILYHEKPVETQYQRATPRCEREVVCEPMLTVQSARCSLSGPATAEAEVELSVRGDVFEQVSQSLVCSMEPDESKPKSPPSAALVVYYAGEGERLWDIAKRYNTDVDEVALTNELPDGVIHRKTMLLIPSV